MRKHSILILIFIALFLFSCNPYDRAKGSTSGDIVNVDEICIGSLVHSTGEFRDLDKNGVQLARPHPGPFVWQWVERIEGTYDWSVTDEWVKAAQNNEVALLGTIFPYNKWDQLSCNDEFDCSVGALDEFLKGPKEQGYTIPEYRCNPCSKHQYNEFVKAMVERYDGDGNNDMEGLTIPIKYWEIGNEPELRSKTLTFFKGTSSDYIKMLEVGYVSVKEACEDCKVLHAGAAGSPDTLDFWDNILFDGGDQYFDIANIHFIDQWDKTTLNVKDFKNLLNEHGVEKEIWVTEADIFPHEQPQQIIVGAFVAGASKVFFTDSNTAKSVNLNSCLT